MTDLPEWLLPIRDGAVNIDATDLTRFVPPEGGDARPSAVLMLFGEGSDGPDLLFTERAHGMRSHPGQISFPGGSMDPDDASPVAAALREAEVNAVLRVPLAELLDPANRVSVVVPDRYKSPGFLVGPDHDLILWGFTAGLVSRLFDYVGLTEPWDQTVERTLPDYMLRGRRG